MNDPIMARRLAEIRQQEIQDNVAQLRAVKWSLIDLFQPLTQVARALIAGKPHSEPKGRMSLSATHEMPAL